MTIKLLFYFKADTEEEGYCMEDKFELIEDFQSPKRSKTVIDITLQEEDIDDDDWRPKYYDSSEHPLKLMVCYLCS